MFWGKKEYNENLVSAITINYLMLFTEPSLCLGDLDLRNGPKQPVKNKAWHMSQMKERTPWEEPGMKIPHSQQD